MKKIAALALGFAAALLSPFTVQAQDDATAPYAGVGALYQLNDSGRTSDDGYGFHLNLGKPLSGRDLTAVELSFYGERHDLNGGGSAKQLGLIANLVKGFGVFGWQREGERATWYQPDFVPFVVLGLGAVHEDNPGRSGLHPAINAGLGFMLPFNDAGWALRTEVLANGKFDSDSAPGDSFLLDYQFRIGLHVPLRFSRKAAEPEFDEPVPVPSCGVAVVDPVTGRSDCRTDTDRDGVADRDDLCAATPAGTPVDVNGCAASESVQLPPPPVVSDSDGDGIDDRYDSCPGTAAGYAVDQQGCVTPLDFANPQAKPVPDAAAPEAAPTKVVLSSVRFAKNSSELTAEAKALLDTAASTLSTQSELVVELAGHTDGIGNSDYNLALSLLRAEKVRRYLIDKGINRYRLYVEGYGEKQPEGDDNTEAGRSKNRRVDIAPVDVQGK